MQQTVTYRCDSPTDGHDLTFNVDPDLSLAECPFHADGILTVRSRVMIIGADLSDGRHVDLL